MTMQELTEAPSIVSSFARTLRPRLGKVRRSSALPDQVLVQRDHCIDPANLAAYQRLCGFDVSSAVPATYLHGQAFPLAVALMAGPSFPLPLLGLVHVHNTMTLRRAVDLAEPLTVSVHAAELRDHAAGRQFDMHAEISAGDDIVWAGVSTYLHRTPSPASAPGEHSRPTASPVSSPTAIWDLPADAGRRYAAITGDRNPIHLSRLAAKAFGFPRAIAHGMYLHARALAAGTPGVAAPLTAVVSFKTPALLPSRVALETTTTDGDWTLRLSEACSGKPHLEAEITRAVS